MPDYRDMGAFAQTMPGTQGGRRPDSAMNGMQPISGYEVGQGGTQSGATDEGWPVTAERWVQGGLGAASLLPGAFKAMDVMQPAGWMSSALPQAIGMAPGVAAIHNAVEPNPQDVWAHKIDQYIRRKMRGLD